MDRLVAGDPAALARAITLIETGGPLASQVHRQLSLRAGRALVVGFTGPPGAGKSTLIDAYVAALRCGGRTVAVLAVDPSSPISGGAVLGDRIRMGQHTEDPGVFIRSIASRGHLGGLTESIHRIVDAVDAAGRDVIVVETVGTGQSEVEIVEIADVCVVIHAPGLGDDVQAIKAGVLEIADVLVVNKADLPLADRTVAQFKSMLGLRERARQAVPVLATAATLAQGVAEMTAVIDHVAGRDEAHKHARRQVRLQRLIAQATARFIRERVLASDHASLKALLSEIMRGAGDIESPAAKTVFSLVDELNNSSDRPSAVSASTVLPT